MKTQLASLVLIVIGALLLCVLFVWTQFLDDNSYWWSDQQAREYGQAGDEDHRMTYAAPSKSGDADDTDERRANTKARFADALRDLQLARDRRNRTTLVLKWAGIGLITVGAIGYFASRAAD